MSAELSDDTFPDGDDFLSEILLPAGNGDLVSPAGNGDVVSPAGNGDLVSPAGNGGLVSPAGNGNLVSSALVPSEPYNGEDLGEESDEDGTYQRPAGEIVPGGEDDAENGSFGDEEQVVVASDLYSWKVDHSKGEHKLKGEGLLRSKAQRMLRKNSSRPHR